MSIHVALHHKTHYKYDRLVNLGPQVVRLRPAPHSRTRILSYSLKITPEKHFINWKQDPQSNYAARLVFDQPTREFCVEVDLVAEMAVLNPFDFFLEPQAEKFPFAYDPALDHELAPFNRKCWLTPAFTKYLTAIRRDLLGEVKRRTKKERLEVPEKDKPRTIDFLVAVNQRLWKDIKYTIRLEPGVQTPEESLEKLSGSCRDSAWLLCQLFRHCGLASRFVSGYLIQLKPDVKSLDGPSGAEKDFTDLHAWTEVYLPGGGWIGLDPTSGLLAGEGHIPLACTPDPSSAAPITGAVDECECEFSHEMYVTRVHESPRVTLPYTDAQWKKIESLGHAIDADLEKGDVRLTMGGEPTFVSIDDPDGAEWNFTAVSHKKRILSGELIKRLRGKFAPGSLLHYGQGKWYPGEPLPRYALAAYWRKDGVPIWKDDSLIADESKNYGHGAKEAKELLSRIAATVGGDPAHLIPAYEDAFYYTWKERRFPVERLAGKKQSERQAGARAHRADFPARLELGGRLLAADQARYRRLDDRQMVFARRRHALAHSRRFADGLAPAAGFDSVGFGKRFSVAAAAGPVAAETAGTAEGISLSPAIRWPRGIAHAARSRSRTTRAKIGRKNQAARTVAAGRKSAASSRRRARARRGSFARHCASSRAMDGCIFSCRRLRRRRIISI